MEAPEDEENICAAVGLIPISSLNDGEASEEEEGEYICTAAGLIPRSSLNDEPCPGTSTASKSLLPRIVFWSVDADMSESSSDYDFRIRDPNEAGPSGTHNLSNNRMSPISEDDSSQEMFEHEFSSSDEQTEEEEVHEEDFEVDVVNLTSPIYLERNPSDSVSDEIYLDECVNNLEMNHVVEAALEGETDAPGSLSDAFGMGNEPLSPFMQTIRNLPSPIHSAYKLTNKLINLSRHLHLPDITDLQCPNCRRIPTSPVTGKCGHSRCQRCVELHRKCPCGTPSPRNPTVNITIRDITEKMTQYIKTPRLQRPNPVSVLSGSTSRPQRSPRGVQYRISHNSAMVSRDSRHCSRPREPMTMKEHKRKGRELVATGKYAAAVPHLAYVAASSEHFAPMFKRLLAQTITVLYQRSEPRNIRKQLIMSVSGRSMRSWLPRRVVECVICTNPLKHPVTTPCGHSFCRECIERASDDNTLLSSVVSAMDIQEPQDVKFIPILVCDVSFPGMPCPIVIFKPQCWEMVRRVTESTTRQFGLLVYEEGKKVAEYGTLVEVLDCVLFEDKSCIITTKGVSRFKILERYVINGCDLASVGIWTDIWPTYDQLPEVHFLNFQLVHRAMRWLRRMDVATVHEIETAFGPLPYIETDELWWQTPDGPHWLWWLTAVLPLKTEIKILMLSSRSLLKRMLAVAKIFDVLNVHAEETDWSTNTTTTLTYVVAKSRWVFRPI